ncbi:Auxin-induced protein 22D [Linum perenne]
MDRSSIKLDSDLNLEATELRLGLPGSDRVDEPEKSQASSTSPTTTVLRIGVNSNNKRSSPDAPPSDECKSQSNSSASDVDDGDCVPPPAKAQAIGWPPIRSYRKNCFEQKMKSEYVKVSMDGAPYLRKIDVKMYKSYYELLSGLESMFKLKFGEYSEREGYNGSDFAPTYEDKDGDWMLVGDVPWEMFIGSCKRLRIMRGSEARGLGCI